AGEARSTLKSEPSDSKTRRSGAAEDSAPSLAAPGSDTDSFAFEGLGIEALCAALATESAEIAQRAARDAERAAKETQAIALAQQVDALHQKAGDIRSEALVSGAFTAAGGALTIASVAAMPNPEQADVAGGLKGYAAHNPAFAGAAAKADAMIGRMKAAS